MSYGFFCERDKTPTPEEVNNILSSSKKTFNEIQYFLTEEIKSKSSYKFYGKNYGWGIVFKKKGKSLITLYPLEKDFTVLIIIKKEYESGIIKILNNKKINSIIENTPAIVEGKWIFFKFSDLKSIEKIKGIIEYKYKNI